MKTTVIFDRTLTTSTVSAFDLVRDECSKGLAFVSNGDGTCTVSDIGTCTDNDVKIPSVYNGEIVTRICSLAFDSCASLTSITIPNSVTSIGSFAFAYCSGLTNITIPNGVTRIGESAFYSCASLTSITIPNSVEEIGDGAFSRCKSLTEITIPDSVQRIGYSAFSDCKSLEKITLPESVIMITKNAEFIILKGEKEMSNNYIVINGKKSELTNEQMELLGIKVRKNPFERVSKNESYYNISDKTVVRCYTDGEDETDRGLYNSVNYFNDLQFAIQIGLHQLLYRKLLKFAYDNGCEDTKGWNGTDGHWTIRYNDDSCCFRAYYQERFKASGVYFSSEEGTQRAIKEVVEPFMKEHPEFVW